MRKLTNKEIKKNTKQLDTVREDFEKAIKEHIDKNPYDYINPAHYQRYSVQAIDMAVAIWGEEKVSNACEIMAFFYRMRMGTKPDNPFEQELQKEEWFLNKRTELKGKK